MITPVVSTARRSPVAGRFERRAHGDRHAEAQRASTRLADARAPRYGTVSPGGVGITLTFAKLPVAVRKERRGAARRRRVPLHFAVSAPAAAITSMRSPGMMAACAIAWYWLHGPHAKYLLVRP